MIAAEQVWNGRQVSVHVWPLDSDETFEIELPNAPIAGQVKLKHNPSEANDIADACIANHQVEGNVLRFPCPMTDLPALTVDYKYEMNNTARGR